MNSSKDQLEEDLNEVQNIAFLVIFGLLIFVVLALMKWGKFSLLVNTSIVVIVAFFIILLLIFYLGQFLAVSKAEIAGLCLDSGCLLVSQGFLQYVIYSTISIFTSVSLWGVTPTSLFYHFRSYMCIIRPQLQLNPVRFPGSFLLKGHYIKL